MDGFDVARGLAAAMVVVLHATLLPQSTVDLPQPVCRMAVLLLISGIMAAPALTRSWSYSRERALDLLWLYLVWTPITLLALKGEAGLASLPRELIAPSTHLWYIGGLALLVLTVPLLRHVPATVPLTLSGGAALWYLEGGRTGEPGHDQIIHFAVFFYAGLYGRRHILQVLTRCGSRVGGIAAVALVAILLLPLPHNLVTLGSGAMLLLVAQGLADSPARAPLAWLGRHTSGIYLAHVPLLVIAGRMIGPAGPAKLALLIVGAIIGCLVLRVIADRMALGWLYRRPPFTLFDYIRSTRLSVRRATVVP